VRARFAGLVVSSRIQFPFNVFDGEAGFDQDIIGNGMFQRLQQTGDILRELRMRFCDGFEKSGVIR